MADKSDKLGMNSAKSKSGKKKKLLSRKRDFRTQTIPEAVEMFCVKRRPYSDIIELCLAEWAAFVDEKLIISVAQKSQKIALIIEDTAMLSADLCGWIGTYLGPFIVEMSVTGSNNYTWKQHFLPILVNSVAIEELKFVKTDWLTDNITNQICTKFSKCLRVFTLENNPGVGDNTLFHIGKKLDKLTTVNLDCCMKMSDTGIAELSKRLHFSSLRITHNVYITDMSMCAVIGRCQELSSLALINCPGIGDRTISCLYEASAAWGTKRNTETLALTYLDLRDNHQLTFGSLNFLATANPSVTHLDLRDCTGIDLTKGLLALEMLKNLSVLKIGPTNFPVDPDSVVESLLFHMAQLRVLDIKGVSDLCDTELGELMDATLVLEELYLSDMQFGSKTIEGLCSNCPNIRLVSLTGSTILTDADVRCLMTVCLYLEDITISRCPELTNGAFTRVLMLKRLQRLDISHCSDHLTGYLLGSFTDCPLTFLNLSGLCFNPVTWMPKMSGKTILHIKDLVVSDNNKLTPEDCKFLTDNFLNCESIDISGCSIRETALRNLKNQNPFLSFVSTLDFFGYKMDVRQRGIYKRFHGVSKRFRMHYAARIFQRAFKKQMEHRKTVIENYKLAKVLREAQLLTKIQSIFRMKIQRARTRVYLRAARVITCAVRWILLERYFVKVEKAKAHYRRHLRKFVIDLLRMAKIISKQQLGKKTERLQPKLAIRIRRRMFNSMFSMRAENKDNMLCEKVMVLWEICLLRRVIKGWRTLNGTTRNRAHLLIGIFQNCIPAQYFNSTRQKATILCADHFSMRRVVLPAWACLCDDFLRARLAELLMPMAIQHAKTTFFNHFVRKVFLGILTNKKNKYFKRQAKLKGERHRLKFLRAQFFSRANYVSLLHLAQESMINNAIAFYLKMLQRIYFLRGIYFAANMKQQVAGVKRASEYYTSHLFRMALFKGLSFVRMQKIWRQMNDKANLYRRKKLQEKNYANWKKFWDTERNLVIRLRERYLKKIMKKLFHKGFVRLVEMKREYLRSLAAAVADEKEREKAMANLGCAVTTLKAHYRGYKAREYVRKFRVQSLFAIMILQRSTRRMFAYRELRKLKRVFKLQEANRELNENHQMKFEDGETRFYNYKLNSLITIQRCFRGYKGRSIAFIAKIAMVRGLHADYYEDQVRAREHVEAQKRAKVAQENNRNKAATEIQKIIRGKLARKRFVVLKRENKKEKSCVIIQREYRRHFAKMKLQAITRDKDGRLKYMEVRRQRGSVLRMFGLLNRKTQNLFSGLIAGLGIDPQSFNYKPKELYQEILQDYQILKDLYKREKYLWTAFRNDPIERAKERRKQVIAAGWSLRVFDPVRIIEDGHPFYGLTGTIVRIDQSLAGVPLYEVKLDRFLRQTFVRMTTDALVYYDTDRGKHMAKAAAKPLIRDRLVQPHIVFGTDPTNPFCNRKNVIAAWTIQRAWRCHRARKVAGRLRFEFWKRAADSQKILYNQLADTNTQTRNAYAVTGLLGMRVKRAILYDEMRHPLFPGRYSTNAQKTSEARNIKKELEIKVRQRAYFIERASQTKGKVFFSTGAARMAGSKQISMMLSMMFGMFSKNQLRLEDFQGTQGARAMAKQKTKVQGMDMYNFTQFVGSPHVRYSKAFLYQGEWTGIPLIQPLRPHGEGLVIFFDGWGYAREDKVLYLTIIKCTGLVAADLTTSDPYCDIFCNGTNVQSSVKWQNLNPVYYESFEIDVTNPSSKLIVRVMDKDFLGSDEFLGQVQLRMGNYEDGEEHIEVHQLLGEDINTNENYDLGEIHLKIRWSERVFEDDVKLIAAKNAAIVIMQAFFRQMSAKFRAQKKRAENVQLMKMVRVKATKITSVCRMRFAKRELIRLRRRRTATIRIQKRIRIFIAKKRVARKRLEKKMAIIIQKYGRGYNARKLLARIKKSQLDRLNKYVTVIQKWGRRLVAQVRVDNIFARRGIRRLVFSKDQDDNASLGSMDSDNADALPKTPQGRKSKKQKKSLIADWIGTYGRDPEYGLRRNRRITETAFQRMLKLKYVRLLTKTFGIVYVERYPSKLSEEEIVSNAPLTNRDDFVTVFFPSFNPRTVTRAEAIKLIASRPFQGLLHIPSTVLMRKTVDFTVTVIQCCIRKKIALKKLKEIMRIHAAFAILQKKFRQRHERYHSAAKRITSLFHRIWANKIVRIRRIERKAAIIIQCSYRCYHARGYIFNCRSLRNISVLRCSSFVPRYPPEKCLDLRDDTFWMSNSPVEAELRVEFRKKEQIESIWIMANTMEASPNFVSISYVKDKKSKEFERLYNKVFLKQLRGLQWHKFIFPAPVETKYFRLLFEDNYSDEISIGIQQIRFQKCKETTPIIDQQPSHFVLNPGPSVGSFQDVTLRCRARGWPYPTFQWYRNGKMIPGANKSQLRLRLSCPESSTLRTYRCKKCAMVSKKVPINAYHVRCGNCNLVFAFNEATPYDNFVKNLQEQEEALHAERTELEQLLKRLRAYSDAKNEALLADAMRRAEENDSKLVKLKEARYFDKYDIEASNKYANEGIYCCYVQNLRGGNLLMTVKSIRAVVAVEHGEPFFLDVRPVFNPRRQGIRKKWCAYSSILGHFIKGRLNGIVTVRYADNAFYEGPYVSEEWIDTKGVVNPKGKSPAHYGVFTTPNNYVYEGYNVDNHFDPENIQSSCKLTLPNGECYEGKFADEMFHGIGIYYYSDGSTYEGEWHKGTRFGHGQFRSCEGWTYEGFFDTNRRHGTGSINWVDGSFYIGEWYFEKITGRGMYISRLRDVYKGDLVDSQFHGYGELLYTSGARYMGSFRNGKKFGKGIYSDVNGNEYYGYFVDDELDGEVVVKCVIKIEELGQDNFEVKVGIFEKGKFINWKVKFSHPIATKQFIKMFDDNKAMYDSVYSMILAKNLPNVPDGVDINNRDVQRIITRIRDEAGDLVSEHALQQAYERISQLQEPIATKKEEVKALKESIKNAETLSLQLEQDAAVLFNKFLVVIDIAEKEAKKAVQYWVDDPRELSGKHQEVVKKLSAVSRELFFEFKAHRFPPPFVKKICDAVSLLLGTSRDWKQQQLLFSDSQFNAREGDEQALRFKYDCKLVHLLKDYDVYKFCVLDFGEFGGELGKILADPRFRRDSYYVESCGPAAPPLVDWIKLNYQYLLSARNIIGVLKSSEEKKVEAYRLKALSVKRRDEIVPLIAQANADKKRAVELEEEIGELEIAMTKAKNNLEFLQETFEVSRSKERKLDYYERLEKTMEGRKELLQIETALRVCIDGVVQRFADERQIKMKLAAARGVPFVEPPETHPQLVDWITTEINDQQSKIIASGKTLGYSYEAEPNAINEEQTQVYINLVVDLVVLRMNERYNDFASSFQWVSMKGHRFNIRFLYILAWKYWKELALKVEDEKAIAAWEQIFGSPETCALMSVEARINERMSDVAREQGRVWGAKYPAEIEKAEATLAYKFYCDYPEDTARMALEVKEDTSGAIPPSTLAACLCWMKLHPGAITEIKDIIGRQLADEFQAKFKSETAADAFRVISGIASEAEMVWYDQAVEWRTYNSEAYDEAAEAQVTQMAKEFQEALGPNVKPAEECAKIINYHKISELILDVEVKAEYEQNNLTYFNANCFATRNQGIVRAATQRLNFNQEIAAHRQWAELETATENFRKGTYLFLSDEARENPSADRFYGFRNRLKSKYAWLYGYLSYRQIELIKDVRSYETRDPFGKAFHNIRPSTLKQVMKAKDEEFKKFKYSTELGLKEIFTKLSIWNTYFGMPPQFGDQSDEMRAVWSAAKDLVLEIKKTENSPPENLFSATKTLTKKPR